MIDYSSYSFKFNEIIILFVSYAVIVISVAILFYDSMYACFIGAFGYFYYVKLKKKEYINKRQYEIRTQFCKMIESLSVAFIAGCSVDNAFMESYKDMERLYGASSYIVIELKELIHQMTMNRPVEKSLSNMADRTGIPEIKDFSVVFTQAKKSGGNFRDIISKTVYIISQKVETEKEIQVILNGKLFEQKVMSVIPFFIIAYLRYSSGSFMSVLYHNIMGVIVMTICLILYIFALLLSKKIADIEV